MANSLPAIPDDPKYKAASKAVTAAQEQFERDSKAARQARRKAFSQAQKEGLSLREIGEEVGLHRSRVAQIIKGK
jgi:DNA-directed RNA polymerase specialized sigma24 family protein